MEKYELIKQGYLQGKGPVYLASEYDVSVNTIKGWIRRHGWKDEKNGLEEGAPRNKKGAPSSNKNAVGNKGGGAPGGNENAVTHGFFRTIFPDDEEVQQLVEIINEKGPLDMLWENIVIKYTAIVRAQKIMFVQDKDDLTKELKKEKDGEKGWEEEYELQFAWDKQATFLNAQSRAMSTLANLIQRFKELAHKDDERRLKLESMQLDVDKKQEELKILRGEDGEGDNDSVKSFVKAVTPKAEDVALLFGGDDDTDETQEDVEET